MPPPPSRTIAVADRDQRGARPGEDVLALVPAAAAVGAELGRGLAVVGVGDDDGVVGALGQALRRPRVQARAPGSPASEVSGPSESPTRGSGSPSSTPAPTATATTAARATPTLAVGRLEAGVRARSGRPTRRSVRRCGRCAPPQRAGARFGWRRRLRRRRLGGGSARRRLPLAAAPLGELVLRPLALLAEAALALALAPRRLLGGVALGAGALLLGPALGLGSLALFSLRRACAPPAPVSAPRSARSFALRSARPARARARSGARARARPRRRPRARSARPRGARAWRGRAPGARARAPPPRARARVARPPSRRFALGLLAAPLGSLRPAAVVVLRPGVERRGAVLRVELVAAGAPAQVAVSVPGSNEAGCSACSASAGSAPPCAAPAQTPRRFRAFRPPAPSSPSRVGLSCRGARGPACASPCSVEPDLNQREHDHQDREEGHHPEGDEGDHLVVGAAVGADAVRRERRRGEGEQGGDGDQEGAGQTGSHRRAI